MIYTDIFQFILGSVFLFYGADYLIDSSKSIAQKYNISPFIIGITLIAFGTSLPELIVGVIANYRGESGLVLGNVIGSNITNIGLILGIATLFYPIHIKYEKVKSDLLWMLAFSCIVTIAIQLEILTMYMGLLFLSLLILYTTFLIRSKSKFEIERNHTTPTISSIWIVAGIIGLGVGSHYFIQGAVGIAETLGISTIIIGMTVVALGTSLPELATTLMAVKMNEPEVAIGNIIGSNIINIIAVLGISLMINDINIPMKDIYIDITFLLVLTFSMILCIRFWDQVSQKVGFVLILIYIYFIYLNFR